MPNDKQRSTTKRAKGLPEVRRSLADGRRVELVARDSGEELEIRSPQGRVEVSIRFDRDGPVVRIHGARLELETAEEMKLRCERFDIESRKGARLVTGGNFEVRSKAEIRMKSSEQTFIDGDWVNLNCLDRTGYHDDPAQVLDVEADEADTTEEPPEDAEPTP
jgi:hypothetical protein